MGTAYGINNCTFWLPLGAGGRDAAVSNQQIANGIFTDTGTTNALDGQLVEYAADAVTSNFATQTSSGARPIAKRHGGWQTGDGAEYCLVFPANAPDDPSGETPNAYLNLPSSCAIGNGSPANEGTIFMTLRWGWSAGFPISISGLGLWMTSDTAPGIFVSGANHVFPMPHTISRMSPQVVAVRFAASGGVVGANQTKLYFGTNYADVITSNVLTSAQTGGCIGSLGTSAGNFLLDMDVYEALVFNQALSDANMSFLLQALQDRVCPQWTNSAQLLMFGDSRTYGYNSNVGRLHYSRSWPVRCIKQIGGYARMVNIAVIGQTISQQQTVVNTYLPTLNKATYGKAVCMGEIGINDVIAGSSAATIRAALTSLWNSMLSGGATNVIAMTIAPSQSLTSPQQTVLAAVNAWIRTPGSLPVGVTLCDNGADNRFGLTGYPDPGDNLHWLDAGYGVYAQNAAKTLQQVLGISGSSGLFTGNYGVFPSAGSVNLTYGSFK